MHLDCVFGEMGGGGGEKGLVGYNIAVGGWNLYAKSYSNHTSDLDI